MRYDERRMALYQALYNKWRPNTFREVVGQAGVTETLLRQSAAGRLSHAYLFIGTRGTGKTTCAKLLARAANCERPKSGEPCNECPTCLSIINGSNSDVLEIDAASNSGVDNMRALREQTAYMPVEARLRVYIIDECHMLTGAAFNALLKTLEEPPPHVLFILATTELHKVPATILSRCQRFAFRRLDTKTIVNRLLEIAVTEGIPLNERGAELIARLSDGAMRDAISILDQCSGAASQVLGEEEITEALGLFGASDMLEVMSAVVSGDAAAAIGVMSRVYADGTDATVFLSELATLIRDVLILQTTNNRALLVGGYSSDALAELNVGTARATAMLDSIRETQSTLYRSLNKRLDIEICLIRLSSAGTRGYAASHAGEGGGAAPQRETLPHAAALRRSVAAQTAALPQSAATQSAAIGASQTAAIAAAVCDAPARPPQADGPPPPPEDDPDDIPWELPEDAGTVSAEATAVAAKPQRRASADTASPAIDDITCDDTPPSSATQPPTTIPHGDDTSEQNDDTPPLATAPSRAEAPGSAPPAAAVSSGIAHSWGAILRRLDSELNASEYNMVKNLPYRLDGDMLVITAASLMSKSRLDMATVRETVQKVASDVLGRAVSVSIELAGAKNDEALEKLAQLGERFENFTFD